MLKGAHTTSIRLPDEQISILHNSRLTLSANYFWSGADTRQQEKMFPRLEVFLQAVQVWGSGFGAEDFQRRSVYGTPAVQQTHPYGEQSHNQKSEHQRPERGNKRSFKNKAGQGPGGTQG